ncbi:hypothetical protein BIW11_06001, partial [Tropilaelaps mercedesae]
MAHVRHARERSLKPATTPNSKQARLSAFTKHHNAVISASLKPFNNTSRVNYAISVNKTNDKQGASESISISSYISTRVLSKNGQLSRAKLWPTHSSSVHNGKCSTQMDLPAG